MGSNSNNELNSPDGSRNGSKDKELLFFFIKAALTFSSLSDPFLPVLGFLAGFSIWSQNGDFNVSFLLINKMIPPLLIYCLESGGFRVALLKVLERIAILSLSFFFLYFLNLLNLIFSLSQSILPVLFLLFFLFKVFESCSTNTAKNTHPCFSVKNNNPEMKANWNHSGTDSQSEADMPKGKGEASCSPVISPGHFSAKWQDQEEEFWNWFLRLSEKGGWNEY